MSLKGTGNRRSFSDEFRRSAVELVVTQKYSIAAAAKAVGVAQSVLRRWHKQFAPKPSECGEDASLAELKAENQRLRRELRQADMEREILKKATAYFAKQSQ